MRGGLKRHFRRHDDVEIAVFEAAQQVAAHVDRQLEMNVRIRVKRHLEEFRQPGQA